MSTGQTSSITPWTIDAEMAVREKIRLIELASKEAREAAALRILSARASRWAEVDYVSEGGHGPKLEAEAEEEEAQRLTEEAEQHQRVSAAAAAAAHNQPPTTAAKAEAAERARQKTH